MLGDGAVYRRRLQQPVNEPGQHPGFCRPTRTGARGAGPVTRGRPRHQGGGRSHQQGLLRLHRPRPRRLRLASEWRMNRGDDGLAENGLLAFLRATGKGDVTQRPAAGARRSIPQLPTPVLYRGVLPHDQRRRHPDDARPGDGKALKQGRLREAVDQYFASPVAGRRARSTSVQQERDRELPAKAGPSSRSRLRSPTSPEEVAATRPRSATGGSIAKRAAVALPLRFGAAEVAPGR